MALLLYVTVTSAYPTATCVRVGGGPVPAAAGSTKNFLFFAKLTTFLSKRPQHNILRPMFETLHYEPRQLKATETRLKAIYDAAYLGLKGNNLAIAAGMMPSEYRQLCQLDPVAEMAELKGRADSEASNSRALHAAAQAGDAKAALAILQHRHDWTAKQEISVDVFQKISITQALADASARVIEGTYADANLQLERRTRIDDAALVAEVIE